MAKHGVSLHCEVEWRYGTDKCTMVKEPAGRALGAGERRDCEARLVVDFPVWGWTMQGEYCQGFVSLHRMCSLLTQETVELAGTWLSQVQGMVGVEKAMERSAFVGGLLTVAQSGGFSHWICCTCTHENVCEGCLSLDARGRGRFSTEVIGRWAVSM
jgi:hypothetical protein